MNILLIEDNEKLAENISNVLRLENYKVTSCTVGKEGLTESLVNNYDLIILDLALPDIDGIKICTKIRADSCKTPILMLTARIGIDSKVEGLDSGADDYLTKPFLMDELLARIRALVRRNSRNKSTQIQINKNVKVDLAAKKVSRNNKELRLSPTEYRVLEFLVINQGKSVTQVEIYEGVWGSNNSDIFISDTLKVHIATLRKKIGDNIIKTVRSQGYMIEENSDYDEFK